MRLALVFIIVIFVSSCGYKNPYYQAHLPHHTPEGFRNVMMPERVKKRGVMHWLVQLFHASNRSKELAELPDAIPPDLERIAAPIADELQVTWIGHSTFLLQYQGMNILTDPVMSKRVSPISFVGPSRHVALPLTREQLPAIDIVLISHNHYDHMDKPTLRYLAKQGAQFLVPLGNKTWFKRQGITDVLEQDWWDMNQIGPFIFRLTPAQHFTGRKIWDLRRSLWGGWAMLNPDMKVYFAGDTGYSRQFKEIGARSGPFDLSLIPIGAYAPQDVLKYVHVSPKEAVQIHQDVRSKKSVAMHWGTFRLTTEPMGEPKTLLKRAAVAAGLTEDEFSTVKIGEMVVVKGGA